MPRFSDPTVVDNTLFPVSQQKAVVFVGHVDGKPFRTEVTLLPFTRIIDWGGQRIETDKLGSASAKARIVTKS